MTSLPVPKYHFPLFLISICPSCNHEDELLESLSNKLYTCKACGYEMSRRLNSTHPLYGLEYTLLELDKNMFVQEHEKTIKKALDLNSSFNSFGKRKIDYSTFIPELLEFFEDNFEYPTYEFGDLKFRASISKEGVDRLAHILMNENKDERN